MPDLSTKTRRRSFPVDGNKRWTRIARGRSLGYRRTAGGGSGTWYVRLHVGGGAYRMEALGSADDVSEADGKNVLNYAQAADAAATWRPDQENSASAGRGLTVRQVVDRYLDWYEVHRRSIERARCSLETHVLPELGDLHVEDLTTDRLRRWQRQLAESPARLRGGGRRKAETEDAKRARKATANRVLHDFRAALNRALEDGLVSNGDAWRRLRPFPGTDTARPGYFKAEELQRLLNSCPVDFRRLVLAAIYTGARYSELAALTVDDFRPEGRFPVVRVRKTKSGTARVVHLGLEGFAFFDSLTAGRLPGERLLLKKGGKPWGRNHQLRPMRQACEKAKVEVVGFHQLRHTYASLYLMSGGSLVALAKQLGHTTTRMVELHYGHLADSWRAGEAKEHAPSLGLVPDSPVVALRRKPGKRPKKTAGRPG